MNETKYWICDKCGGKISNVNDGWVEWLIPTTDDIPERNNFGMRIVHSTACTYTDCECDNHKAIPGDASLKDFTGADGLMGLLFQWITNLRIKKKFLR